MALIIGGPATLVFDVSWERAPGVTTPELAATWCALDIRIDGRIVTLVQDERGGGVRTAVHTSAYPLAEWIATRWSILIAHLRPSAIEAEEWTWRNVHDHDWLRSHNLRGAGDGMPWPDFTVVPEGPVSRVVWHSGSGLSTQPISFLTSGDLYLSTETVRAGLANFVGQVLDRLREAGITGTPLQQEWSALAELSTEEEAYTNAIARLGLDPFDVEREIADQVDRLSTEFDDALFGELLDTADPTKLLAAAQWVNRAQEHARLRTRPHVETTSELPNSAPWQRGYELARAYRRAVGVDAIHAIPIEEHVGTTELPGDPSGIQGVVRHDGDRVGLVVPESHGGGSTTRFMQARALGLSLITPRRTAILDTARTELTKASRAFAAELLAPAEGVRTYLSALPHANDLAYDAIADRFRVSPLLIKLQHQNQPE